MLWDPFKKTEIIFSVTMWFVLVIDKGVDWSTITWNRCEYLYNLLISLEILYTVFLWLKRAIVFLNTLASFNGALGIFFKAVCFLSLLCFFP